MRQSLCFALTLCLLLVGTGATLAQDADAESDVRVIELEAATSLQFLQDGEPIYDIPVVPGEAVRFRIENTAGFEQTFYIGTDQELIEPYARTDVGIPEWSTGIQELTWLVPDDIHGLRFGSTVPGFYYTMYGCFSEERDAPDGTVEPFDDSVPCPTPEPGSLTEPTPTSGRPGGRVEVPWAGVAVTFPDTWDIEVESAPATDVEHWTDVLIAYDPIGIGSSVCFAYVDDVGTYDWATALTWSDTAPEIGGLRAARFDSVIPLRGQSTYSSLFVFDRLGGVFILECSSSDPPPNPDWLSIAETFELLPSEE